MLFRPWLAAPALIALMALIVLSAGCFPTTIACDPNDGAATCPHGLACAASGECVAGDGGAEGEGEGVTGAEGEGGGEGEGEGVAVGCMLAPSSCTSDPRQFCDDAAGDPARGSCVPSADVVTICDNTTGSYGAPTISAPALFDGVFVSVVPQAPACAGDFIGPDAFAVRVRYFDVEGDVRASAADIVIYFEGNSLAPHDVVDEPDAHAVGKAGTLSFSACVPVDTPSIAVELHDRFEHASNGVCVKR